jgi:hypothetical protein
MNGFIFGLLILILSLPCIGQETPVVPENNQFKTVAEKQINQLKAGALLVRLQTKKNSVSALRQTGQDKLADKIETRQNEYNFSIVTAFKNNFRFCPVYFFLSDYSKYIVEKQFDKVIFLNDRLVEDTTIKFNYESFLTAEFGTIEQDTAKYFAYYRNESNNNEGLEKNKNYYGEPGLGFSALIIKSEQFIQLKRPFPFYVRTYESLPIEREKGMVVSQMNKKLSNFYYKVKK